MVRYEIESGLVVRLVRLSSRVLQGIRIVGVVV